MGPAAQAPVPLSPGPAGRARLVRLVAHLVLLAALGVAGAYRTGPLPPLGPLLDPVRGIWSVARQAELPREAEGRIPGLEARVEVRYDDRGVPHIFAASEPDAIRALGYVVARDRLFQLELQWRAGAGRLTELLGPRALALDRAMRALGLPWAAERKLAALDPAGPEARLLRAYADGVNAWLDRLGRGGLPFEYHLLGTRPARWEPICSIHLLHRMGWTLAYNELELVQDAARRALGAAAADALYPVNSPIQEPVVPNGRTAPRFEWGRLPAPEPGPVASGTRTRGADGARSGPALLPPRAPAIAPVPLPASNNWAVAPARTAAGHALLAGDPHLDLTLPSIWYEAHLVVPGRLDVYGVTIPGAPAIVLGFNRDVAWSMTNTDADVLDRYREVVDDGASPTRYRLDGAWRPLAFREEIYRGPGGDTLARDTLRFTYRGPLQRHRDGWLSIRWTVLEPGSGFGSLLRAAQARSAAEWLAATSDYAAPSQNMLVADRTGTIAIRATGLFPIRPSGRGDTLQDGTGTRNDWTGFWPLAEYPAAVAPRQGYLASANQQPLDPRVNPRYLSAHWYAPWRALRINRLLRGGQRLTPDDMRRFQTDPGSEAAELIVPALLAAAGRRPVDDTLARAARLLAEWDRRYTRENTRAVLFEAALGALRELLWDELDALEPALPRPADAILVALLHDPSNPWWDNRETPERDDRDAVLARALREGYRRTVARYGPAEGGGWVWSRIRHANIRHLLGIPALSALGIPVQGGPGTLNPSSGGGGFGSSWRMVVELGPELRAWGIYPGGQSGNPASPRYLDRLSRWEAGALDALRFPRAPAEVSGPAARLSLEPAS
ncbi:MAG TPA: penicillin acylase family protein [Gemmatimonadales bacterium]|nr:penicillin acylase family protein [Gemmatimonadales bacterium]